MTSSKKVEANKANSRKSTGPRTDSGKTRASMNALKHGLTAARAILVADESEADLESLRTGFAAAWQPVGAVEVYLVNRLTHLAWKIGRAERLEAALFERGIHAVETDRLEAVERLTFGLTTEAMAESSSSVATEEVGGVPHRWQGRHEAIAKLRLAESFVRLSSGEDLLGKALRYQGEAERSFFKTSNALERIQRQRQGDYVEAPLSVEVNVENGHVPERGQPDPPVCEHESHGPESDTDLSVQAFGEERADKPTDIAELEQAVEASPDESVETLGTNPETKPSAVTEEDRSPLAWAQSSPGPGVAPPAAASRPSSGPPPMPRDPEMNPFIAARLRRMVRAKFK